MKELKREETLIREFISTTGVAIPIKRVDKSI